MKKTTKGQQQLQAELLKFEIVNILRELISLIMPTDNYESDGKKKEEKKQTQRKAKKCRELTSFNRLCYNRRLYKEAER